MTTDFLATSPGKRILLGQLGARGDCLYATAVARQIKVDYPGCRLTWAVGSMCRPLIEGNPYVDEIWEFPMAGHGDMLAAWERFEAEAQERQRHGDYDEVFFTQIFPNNFKNFDGTVRASIFRGYPHPITVPVAPVVRLTPQEVERVRAFAESHALGASHRVVLFEFTGQSSQSFTGPEFALEAARAIVSRLPDAIVILASHLPLDGGHERIVDGSKLAFRENAELTKYCHLLIGCSSGLSWLCTSDWAKPLPTIQLLRRDTSAFASFVHDHEYFALPTDTIIEMTDSPPARLAECVEAVFKQSFPEARQRYHERIALKFDAYARTLDSVLKRGYYSHVLLSAWNTMRRYGPRLGLLAVPLRLATMGAGRLLRGAVLSMAGDGGFLRRRLHDFEGLARIKILRMPSFEFLVHKIESLEDQLTRCRALNGALQSKNEVLHTRVGDFSSDRQLLQEEIRRVRQSRDDLNARVEQAGIQRLTLTDDAGQLPISLTAHAVFDPADSRFPPAHAFIRLPEIPEEAYCIDIVDVGAEPLEFEEDIYEPLTRDGKCRIIGFDPFEAESGAGGNPTDSDSRGQRIVLPYFIGSGGPARFHVNRFRSTSSLFPSNMGLLKQFSALPEMCSTERMIEVETKRLDDIQEIQACDFLKVDVQGGDYDVVAHGTRVLERTLFVHIETEFSCIYSDQPLFPKIDGLLRSQGFEFIDYVKFGWNTYRALWTPYVGSRLLWADSIYMKDPRRIAERGPLLLLRAAFIAHVNYRKYDLAAHLLHLYDEQCGSALKESYAASFFA